MTKLCQVTMTVLFFTTLSFFTVGAQAETSGTFTVVKGDVQVISANGSAVKAKIGQKVVPSDTISASADSRAKIVMADKNIINISPETKMTLEKYIYDPATDNKQVTVNVLYGKVRATVEQKYDGEKNKFHIKTPAAVAGVRGTDFLTSYSRSTKETKIITFEGKVAVGLPGPQGQIMNPVMVPPGQMTSAIQGTSPTPPMPVPAEEFKQMKTETQAELGGKKDAATSSEAAPATEEKKAEGKDDKKSDDNPKKDEGQKSDEGKAKEDSAKKEDAKKEEPKKEEARKEEPKKDDVKKTDDKRAGDENKGPDSKGGKDNGKAANEKGPAPDSPAGPEGQKTGTAKADTPAEQKREPASAGPATNAPPGQDPKAPGSPPPTAEAARGPAPGTMMLDRADLAPTQSREVMTPTLQNAMPVVNNFTPYVPPNQTTQQIINQTTQIIQNNTATKSTVIIHIQK